MKIALSRSAALATMLAPLVTRRVRADELTAVRVVGPPNDGFKAVYYGVSAGIFRKYGVTVQPSLVNSGQAATAALIGGSAEVAFTNMLAVIQAHLRGVPIQCIAAATWYQSDKPITAMLVLKDSPLKSARDLNGQTVGAPSLGDINSSATMAWIDQNGGDAKSVKLIEVPPSAAVPLLEQGRCAAVTVNEPTVTQSLATGKVWVFAAPLDAIAKRFQASAFAIMAPVVAQSMDVMSRFARGMHESQVYTNAHPEDTVAIVAGYTGATPETVARSRRVTDPEYVDPRNLQPLIEVLAKYGAITRTFPASELISPAAVKVAG